MHKYYDVSVRSDNGYFCYSIPPNDSGISLVKELIEKAKKRCDCSVFIHCGQSSKEPNNSSDDAIKVLQSLLNTPEVIYEKFEPDNDAKPVDSIKEAIEGLGWYFHEAGDNEGYSEDDWDSELPEIDAFGVQGIDNAIYDYGDVVETYGWCWNSHGSTRVYRINREEFLKRCAECKAFCTKYSGCYSNWKVSGQVWSYIIRDEDCTKKLASWN